MRGELESLRIGDLLLSVRKNHFWSSPLGAAEGFRREGRKEAGKGRKGSGRR